MTFSMLLIFFVTALAYVEAQRPNNNSPTVTTNLGQMSGRTRRFGNEFVYQFLGVRYAVAPVGRLRFKKPVPVQPWSRVLDASRYGPSCSQTANTRWLPNRQSNEDCLLLNIYVPRTLTPNTTKSVMLWIHGGGFVAGQGMSTDGSNLALTGDVIVVTINYRLDVFGFLSTGDSSSLGNYGVWDMLMAARFVKDNIEAFGGNSNSITLFGESGGGYAVGLLALSPLSQGLFQRVICESGVGLSPRAIAFDPVNFTRRLSDNLGCTTLTANGTMDTVRFMRCIQRRRTREILQASARARNPDSLVWRLEIAPTVDGEIFPERPEFLISRSNTQHYNPMPDIDFMAGINNAEGSLIFWPLRNFEDDLNFSVNRGIPTRVLCDNIAPSLSNDYYNGSQEISQGMCQLYSTNESEPAQGRQVVNLYGDMMFVAPTVLSAVIHSRNNNGRRTYMYLFSQQPRPQSSPRWFVGAGHGAEVAYVFGNRVINPSLSLQMMKYWSNFAKFGNPNGSPESPQLQWQQFEGSQKNYIDLGPTIQARRDLWPERMQFFTSHVPQVLDRFPRIPVTPWTTPSTRNTITGQGQSTRPAGGQNGRDPNGGQGRENGGQTTSGYTHYLGNDIAYPRGTAIIDDPGKKVTFLQGYDPTRPWLYTRGPRPRDHVTRGTDHVTNSTNQRLSRVTYPPRRALYPTTPFINFINPLRLATRIKQMVSNSRTNVTHIRNTSKSLNRQPQGNVYHHVTSTNAMQGKNHLRNGQRPRGLVANANLNVKTRIGNIFNRQSKKVTNQGNIVTGHVTFPTIPITYRGQQVRNDRSQVPTGHVSVHYVLNVQGK